MCAAEFVILKSITVFCQNQLFNLSLMMLKVSIKNKDILNVNIISDDHSMIKNCMFKVF